MMPILCGNDISFCYFYAVGVVTGPHFCVKLKMCGHKFHKFGKIDKKIETAVKWSYKCS